MDRGMSIDQWTPRAHVAKGNETLKEVPERFRVLQAGDEQLRTLKERCSPREDEPVVARERGPASRENRRAAGNRESEAGAR